MEKIRYKKLIDSKKIDILTSILAGTLANEILNCDGYWLYLNVLEGGTPLCNSLYDKMLILEPAIRKYVLRDSVKVSSYNGTEHIGFTLEKDSELSLNNLTKKAIIVDDILDSGKTMHNLIELLKTRGFTEFICVTLLDRAETSNFHPNATYYSGFGLTDEWVCGFGMDSLDGTYRDKKDVYQIITKSN